MDRGRRRNNQTAWGGAVRMGIRLVAGRPIACSIESDRKAPAGRAVGDISRPIRPPNHERSRHHIINPRPRRPPPPTCPYPLYALRRPPRVSSAAAASQPNRPAGRRPSCCIACQKSTAIDAGIEHATVRSPASSRDLGKTDMQPVVANATSRFRLVRGKACANS